MYRVKFLYNGEYYSDVLSLMELNTIEREALIMGDRLVIISLTKL